jgi:sodium/potassium-transporting ATPase subunit alpha
MSGAVETTEHKGSLTDVISKLATHEENGLSDEEHNLRLARDGENRLTPPKERSLWLKFLDELTGFFALLLWAGAGLCFMAYSLQEDVSNLYLGIVLSSVVIVTGCFSFYQNLKSDNLMKSFKNMMPPQIAVTRNDGTSGGTQRVVEPQTLVVGDIVSLKGGDLVPADLRIIECSDNMVVDNAALTGESEPQKRRTECTHDDPLETANLCFFGTQVPEGECRGVVIACGDSTIMGRIAQLAMGTENEQTPINKELEIFIHIISAIAIVLGVVFFIIGAFKGTDIITNLVFMIGIIVANVPEGLLATVTVCLTLTAQRMHKKMVLVKQLEGVETLGSTSCICSDKTGTLTQNVMTVAEIVYSGAAGMQIFETGSSRCRINACRGARPLPQ